MKKTILIILTCTALAACHHIERIEPPNTDTETEWTYDRFHPDSVQALRVEADRIMITYHDERIDSLPFMLIAYEPARTMFLDTTSELIDGTIDGIAYRWWMYHLFRIAQTKNIYYLYTTNIQNKRT